MLKNKKLRGYVLVNSDDGLSYDFVIATNVKEAKKMMIENCNEWINEYENPILEFYAKWVKDADIKGLKFGEFVEDNELLKRNICSYLEYGTCPLCKDEEVLISVMMDGTICCSACEEKLE